MNGIALTWDPVPGVSMYTVYCGGGPLAVAYVQDTRYWRRRAERKLRAARRHFSRKPPYVAKADRVIKSSAYSVYAVVNELAQSVVGRD